MKNNDFEIAFCVTNLLRLAGEPSSEEKTKKEQAMIRKIECLKSEEQKCAIIESQNE